MKPTLQQAHGWQVVLGIALLAFASPAFAYLDPSTGSMVVSAIVGIFASIALAVKTYWYRLKNLFKGKPRAEETRADPARKSPGEG
jgi:hypothetical protein